MVPRQVDEGAADVPTQSRGQGPSDRSDVPDDPFAAARRYAKPGAGPSNHGSPGASSGRVGPADGRQPVSEILPEPPTSKTPMILGVVGIVGWFLCGIGAIGSVVVGVIGQRKARELGQSDLLPKVAWIGGLAVILLDIVVGFFIRPTYGG